MTLVLLPSKLPRVIVIMGATGTGKTKLSIDIATRLRAEIVNSDKIQVYRGLDITTNKVPVPERRGVPHHLLGSVDPAAGEVTPSAFRALAGSVIKDVTGRGKVPVVAGGSNSFIHALVADRYDPRRDVFAAGDVDGRGRAGFRYRCCFVWVDVETAALREYLDKRVEEMVGSGMVEELEGYFGDGGRGWERNVGLNKAIGVPEFGGYFGKRRGKTTTTYGEAVRAIKEDTWRLAVEQVRKIRRLGELGWALRRVDATEVVRARLSGAHRTEVAVEEERWGRDVVGPAMGVVGKFLEEEEDRGVIVHPVAAAAAASCCCLGG